MANNKDTTSKKNNMSDNQIIDVIPPKDYKKEQEEFQATIRKLTFEKHCRKRRIIQLKAELEKKLESLENDKNFFMERIETRPRLRPFFYKPTERELKQDRILSSFNNEIKTTKNNLIKLKKLLQHH